MDPGFAEISDEKSIMVTFEVRYRVNMSIRLIL